MNKDERTKILKACHVDATAGHMGIKKTVSKITERFMWPGVIKDVKNLVCCLLLINVTIIIRLCFYMQISTCDACQRTNRKISTGTPELNPVPVKSPWYRIGIDFIGPLKPSINGYHYILTISDYCTKWVEAIPTSTKQASEVANSLFKVVKINISMSVTITF